MNDTKISGGSAWRKHLKRSLLLLAVPFVSALSLGMGPTTASGYFVHRLLRIPTPSRREPSRAHWLVSRTNGQYIMRRETDSEGNDTATEHQGLVASIALYWGVRSYGFWAPTHSSVWEHWEFRDFVKSLSSPSEYWAAIVEFEAALDLPKNQPAALLQSFIDGAVAQRPNRPNGLVETHRGPMDRVYQKTSLLLSGYIHNAIVLVCAAGGLFELGRAVRGFVRSP